MARTTIDVDDEALAEVMRRFGFVSKSEAVNYALRQAVPRAMTLEQALAMRGTGWDGDLDAMRPGRVVDP